MGRPEVGQRYPAYCFVLIPWDPSSSIVFKLIELGGTNMIATNVTHDKDCTEYTSQQARH